MHRASCCLVALVFLGLPLPAVASSTGISGYCGPTTTCQSCHTSSSSLLSGTLTMPASVTAGKTYTFTYSCSISGTMAYKGGGVDVFASCGSLSLAETNTKTLNGQLVHSMPKSITGNQITWSFKWTAPASPTSCGFHATGLLANMNLQTSGDQTCMAMKAIQVLAAADGGVPDSSVAADGGKVDGAKKTDGAGKGDGTVDTSTSQDQLAAFDSSPGLEPGSGGPAADDSGCDCRVGRRAASPCPIILLLGALFLVALCMRRDGP